MTRCKFCKGYLWPWERYTFRLLAYWHVECYLAFQEVVENERKVYEQRQAEMRWREENEL